MNASVFSVRFALVASLALCVIASIGCPPSSDEPGTDEVSHSSANDDEAEVTQDADTPSQESDNETDANADSNTGAGPGADESEQVAEEAYFEELFKDWDEPEAVLFITGRQNGYIEPCGCTGLANQKGGILRRHTFYQELEAKGWPIVPLDLGNQVRRFGLQPVIKFERTIEALTQNFGYEGILLGPDDLRVDSIVILQTIENYQESFNPLISANVSVLIDELTSKYRVIESGGFKIGVTGILGDEFQNYVNNPDVTMLPAREGLDAIIEPLLAEQCDFYVLLAHTTIEETEKLASEYPHFDVVVTAGGDGEPTRDPVVMTTDSHQSNIIQTGYKGMHVGVIGLFAEGEPRIRYQRVPLDSRYQDSEDIKTLFVNYQNQLKTLGLEGLEVRPLAHPSGHTYVGSFACGDCHTTAFDIWENGHDGNGGPHFHATQSLVEPGERTWVQRHFDPECLSCHVTGWSPQKYFPYQEGYLDLEASSHLHGNGCENCHGPGSAHVEAELGEVAVSDEELRNRQLEMRVTKEEARDNLCMECHDLDNSPDFHVEGAWEKYWPQIEHIGID